MLKQRSFLSLLAFTLFVVAVLLLVTGCVSDAERRVRAQEPVTLAENARAKVMRLDRFGYEEAVFDEAEREFHQSIKLALSLGIRYAPAHYGLAYLHFLRAEYLLARTMAERAIAADYSYSDAYLLLVEIAFRMGDDAWYEKGMRLLDDLKEIETVTEETLFVRALLYKYHNEYTNALGIFTRLTNNSAVAREATKQVRETKALPAYYARYGETLSFHTGYRFLTRDTLAAIITSDAYSLRSYHTRTNEEPERTNALRDCGESPFKDACRVAYEKGLLSPTSNTFFYPNKKVTRADCVLFLAPLLRGHALKLKTNARRPFDIAEGDPLYAESVLFLQHGLFTLHEGKWFRPQTPISVLDFLLLSDKIATLFSVEKATNEAPSIEDEAE